MQIAELHSPEPLRESRPRAVDLRPSLPAKPIRPVQPWASIRSSVLTALPLVFADVLAAACSFAIAWSAAAFLSQPVRLERATLALCFTGGIFLANFGAGLYPGLGLSSISEWRLVSFAVGLLGVVFLPVSIFANGAIRQTEVIIALTCLLLAVSLPLARALARGVSSRFTWWGQPVLIVGDGESAMGVYTFLDRHRRLGLRPLGIVGTAVEVEDGTSDAPFLGPLSRIGSLIWRSATPKLIVMPRQSHDEVQAILFNAGAHGLHSTVVNPVDGAAHLWRRVNGCLEWPGSRERDASKSPLLGVKRVIDITLTIILGLLATPLILVIAWLIKLSSPGPVLHRQQRVGKDGGLFFMWKFRTMVCNADRVLGEYLASDPRLKEEWARHHKLRQDPRITFIGRWLRKTSLDELPQLWNVLCGEMSVVGPRPLLPEEADKYGDHFTHVCRVLPGVTGVWQISGRNNTSYAERIELQSYYARNWSLWLDFYILASTLKVVLLRDGAY